MENVEKWYILRNVPAWHRNGGQPYELTIAWSGPARSVKKPKRRSEFIPEDEDAVVDSNLDIMSSHHNASIDIENLLRDISIEGEKSMKREMKDLTKSFEFHTEQNGRNCRQH